MSVKIKVSYSTEKELEAVLNQLKPMNTKCSIAKNPKGKYKRAYIDIEEWGNQDERDRQF